MIGYDPEDRPDDETRPFIPLNNPLPVPEKRPHLRMEFDIEDPEDDEFDLEIMSDDDFDKFAYSFIYYGWLNEADVSPQIYTFKDWEKRRITPFYQNVQEDKKVIYGT